MEHERPVLGDRSKQVLEGRERPAPRLEGIRDVAFGVGRLGHDAGVAQDREQACEGVHPRREQAVRFLFVQPREPATQLVDDLVDRLEGHRFALVTATGKHEHLRDCLERP